MKFITKEFIYFFIFFLEIANILFPNPYVSLGFDPAAKKAARHILESKPPVAPNVGSPKQLEKISASLFIIEAISKILFA